MTTIFFYSITKIAGGESFHTTDLKGNWKRKEIKMIEYFKINKKTKKTVNTPKVEIEPKLKAYVLIRNSNFTIMGNDLEIEGKIYLLKEQAEANAKILQIKHPFADYKVYEMEVE